MFGLGYWTNLPPLQFGSRFFFCQEFVLVHPVHVIPLELLAYLHEMRFVLHEHVLDLFPSPMEFQS